MHFPQRYASLALVTISIGLLVTSCSESKVAQCNKVNSVAIKTKSFTAPKDSAGLTQFADSIETIRTEMQAVKVEDEKLKDFQTRFVELYTEVGLAAREISKVLATKDQATKDQATNIDETAKDQAAKDKAAKDKAARDKVTKDAQAAIEKEAPLLEEINQYCSS